MSLNFNNILTGIPVAPHNFDVNYMIFLPWEIMEIIWTYLPITTKIRAKKKYYERYHYMISPSIRNYDAYIADIIKHRHKYLFKLILSEKYLEWSQSNEFCHISGAFDSYSTYVLSLCDANKNPEFKNCLIYFKKEIAENKLKERETYKDYSHLHNIRNIWKEEIIQENSGENKSSTL